MLELLAADAKGIAQSNIRAITSKVDAVRGVNLSQGICALPPHPAILEAARRAIAAGHNSYTPCYGIEQLRQAIANQYWARHRLSLRVDNILVTSGATGAFESVCKSFIEPGDEVIFFEPVYPCHVRQVQGRGGLPRFVRLCKPDWKFDLGELINAFSERTKLIVFSNPGNPTGKVFLREELQAIAELCISRKVIAVVDEVYEYIISGEDTHLSLAALPGMFDWTITIASASKTFFVTGWRVGWIAAPEDAISVLSIKSDDTYICAPAPFQHAIAEGFSLGDSFFQCIRQPFKRKRELLVEALGKAGFTLSPPQGAYYIMADYRGLGYLSDESAVWGLLQEVGVGAVPGNCFYPTCKDSGLLRFCFAVDDEVLENGCERLMSLASKRS
jgi:aminotransferase